MKKYFVLGVCLIVLIGVYIMGNPGVPEITEQMAIENVKKTLDERTVATITNFDNPKVEEVIFKTKPSIYLFDENTNVVGKGLYKITFNTEQDGLLGPIVFYVDKLNGDLIGADFRE